MHLVKMLRVILLKRGKIEIFQTFVDSFQESKDRVDHKSSATKPHTAKVFQAEPRLAKLQLTDLDFLARPTTKQKPKEAPTTSRPNVGLSTSTAEAAQPSTSTSLLPPTTTNRVK